MATGDAGSPKESPTVPVDLGPIGPRQRYEFTPAQESVIGDLAGKMRFVGAFMFALGFLGLVRVIYVAWKNRGLEGSFDIDSLITTIIYSLIGFWTLSASKGFAAVVATVGWDVPHVMDALRSLRKMYTLLFYMLVAAIVASLVLMIRYRPS